MKMDFDTIINCAVKAYVSVYGQAKWNSLSEKQQHDVIMISLRDYKSWLDWLETQCTEEYSEIAEKIAAYGYDFTDEQRDKIVNAIVMCASHLFE